MHYLEQHFSPRRELKAALERRRATLRESLKVRKVNEFHYEFNFSLGNDVSACSYNLYRALHQLLKGDRMKQ